MIKRGLHNILFSFGCGSIPVSTPVVLTSTRTGKKPWEGLGRGVFKVIDADKAQSNRRRKEG